MLPEGKLARSLHPHALVVWIEHDPIGTVDCKSHYGFSTTKPITM
jgi:hypothetical protein